MVIKEAAIHLISKKAGQTAKVSEKFRESLLPINDQLNDLVDQLNKIYTRSVNNYGTFDKDTRNYPFVSDLGSYYSGRTLDFLSLSKRCTSYISAKMKTSAPSTGGYVLFIRYESHNKDWLLVVMLKLRGQVGVDSETLDLNEAFTFDVDHLHEAARVDLAKHFKNDEPYLSFIKRTASANDVTQYFRSALGCTTYIQSKANTDLFMSSLERFCKEKGVTGENKINLRARVYDHLDERNSSEKHASLSVLSSVINPDDPKSFISFIKENEIELSDTFSPYKSSYRRYKRIQSSFSGVKLSFEIENLKNNSVDLANKDSDLLIRNVPKELVAQIKAALGDE